ncbi:MAG: hypothetical protein H6Q72_962 [Firmicutes bacterium]|nr:hypothetical protein [Bacillota bacterium]
MAKIKMQPSFAAGELAPALRRRTDLQKYAIGADTIKNMVVLPQGGLQARIGTKYVASVKAPLNSTRLVSFAYNTAQAYILEFGDYYVRFFMDGAQIVVSDTDSTPYEVATPYPVADIWKLKFEQSADTLYIIHPDYIPRLLTRTDHNAWTLTVGDFEFGPLNNENSTTKRITLSNSDGDTWLYEGETVTATASTGLFKEEHIGSIWGIRYRAFNGTETYTISSGVAFTSDVFRVLGDWTVTIRAYGADMNNSNTTIYKSVDDGSTWFKIKTIVANIQDGSTYSVTGSEDDECLIKISKPAAEDSGSITIDLSGQYSWCYFKITGYTSTTVATAVMQNNFNKGGTPFKTWAEGAWSSYRGWQNSVTFFQNRLMFGGNDNYPNTYWASCVDDYYNNVVSIDQVEDESIQDRLPSRQVNAIEWMIPMQDLIVLTQDSEWTISPSTTTGIFSYKSKIVKQRGSSGCNGSVKPVVITDTVIFLRRNANKVQGLTYTDANGYSSSELSIMADHLFSGYTIKKWAYQQNPNSILWCVRSDGALLSFTYMPEQDVWAWSHHDTDGLFEDVEVIPGDAQDEVYFIVNRTINGSTCRYIEMLAERDVTSRETYWGVDCGASQSYDMATTTVSDLDFLEGKSIRVFADGVNVGKKTVSSGVITLDKAASYVMVGLDYDWLVKTLSIDSGIDRKKSINSVTVSVVDSYGGEIMSNEIDLPIKLPYPGTEYYTGDLIDVIASATWDYPGQVIIQGTGYDPMHIVAITPKVSYGS